jgi:hypothetical protein
MKGLRPWPLAKDEGHRGGAFAGWNNLPPAEVHWYESHGIGRKEFKIKCLLSGLR